MTERERLEKKCSALFGNVADIEKRLKILRDAYWQANNAGYCNAMANELMGGHESSATDYWLLVCSLRGEISALIDIYNDLLETQS